MTQFQAYKNFVRIHDFRLTLGEILRTDFSAEYRKLHTFLRRESWLVECLHNRNAPGSNIYIFTEPLDAITDKVRGRS